jgi:hypothetical protein
MKAEQYVTETFHGRRDMSVSERTGVTALAELSGGAGVSLI